MTDARLTLRTYHEMRQHGDRATALSESLRHEIVVTRGDREVVLHRFDQFNARDSFIQDEDAFELTVHKCVASTMFALGLTEYTIEHYHPRTELFWHRESTSRVTWDNGPRTT